MPYSDPKAGFIINHSGLNFMVSEHEGGAFNELIVQQGQILSMITDGQSLRPVIAAILEVCRVSGAAGAALYAQDPDDLSLMVLAGSTLPPEVTKNSSFINVVNARQAEDIRIECNGEPCNIASHPVIDSDGRVTAMVMMSVGNSAKSTILSTTAMVAGQLFVTALKTVSLKEEGARATDHQTHMRSRISKERLDLYNLMMDAPAMIAVLKEPNHTFELANHMYLKAVSGDTPRQIIGKPLREALPELSGQGIVDILDAVYRTGEPYYGNQVMIQLDRHQTGVLEGAYFNFVYHPVRDVDGEIEGIFVHAVDVTELVKARQQAEESERLMRAVIDTSNYPIAVYRGREMRIELTNQALLDTWNKTAPVIGMTFREALPELEGQGFYELLDQVYATGHAYRAKAERVDLLYDGAMRTFYFDFTYKAMYDENGAIFGILNTAADVTELVESRQRLQALQEQLQLSIQAGQLGIWNYIIDTGEIIWDERTKALFGFPPEAGISTLDEILQFVVADDKPRLIHAIKMALTPGSGGNYDIQYRTQGMDTAQRWIQAQGRCYFDNHGMPVRFSGIAFDITAQKVLEKQKDNFLGIASHELKTPVTSLKAYAQVLEATFKREGNQKAASMLGRMDQQLNKLTSLIGDLLDVTKFQSGKLQYNDSWFDFNTLGDEVVEELQRITSRHAIIKKFGPPARIYADRERIGQVISNLLNNAIKYSPDADMIIMETCLENDTLKVCVQDFGVGIDEENTEKVFEQFYRVSGDIEHTFPGMGLGLYISSEIVKREGGKIWVETSKPGEGATFCFTLPLADDTKTETDANKQ